MKLLNPGPVSLTPRVRGALSEVDLCHREPEFAEIARDVMTRLTGVYPEASPSFVPVLLTGSGTAAVEAMVGSLVERSSTSLVLANGVYGERIAAMLARQSKPSEFVRSPWEQGIDLDKAAAVLKTGRIGAVLAVHHETTTGRLNAVAELGALCRAAGVPLYLDAVSSFGGESIRFDDWNLEACAATANKCLHGAPGVSFVLARRSVFETRPSAATSVYLDLHRYEREQRAGYSPFTQAVHVLRALREALAELDETGGWETRHARYRAFSDRIRAGLADLGVVPLLSSGRSAVLTAYRMPVPETPGYQELHDRLKADGFVVYGGQGHLASTIFRVAVMGDLTRADIERFVRALGRSFR
jgi:2-aminoethylphosphonate-pyruvate transaminase